MKRTQRRMRHWSSAVYAVVVVASAAAAAVPTSPPVEAAETAPVLALLADWSGN